jgi:hypothetical protein
VTCEDCVQVETWLGSAFVETKQQTTGSRTIARPLRLELPPLRLPTVSAPAPVAAPAAAPAPPAPPARAAIRDADEEVHALRANAPVGAPAAPVAAPVTPVAQVAPPAEPAVPHVVPVRPTHRILGNGPLGVAVATTVLALVFALALALEQHLHGYPPGAH